MSNIQEQFLLGDIPLSILILNVKLSVLSHSVNLAFEILPNAKDTFPTSIVLLTYRPLYYNLKSKSTVAACRVK